MRNLWWIRPLLRVSHVTTGFIPVTTRILVNANPYLHSHLHSVLHHPSVVVAVLVAVGILQGNGPVLPRTRSCLHHMGKINALLELECAEDELRQDDLPTDCSRPCDARSRDHQEDPSRHRTEDGMAGERS